MVAFEDLHVKNQRGSEQLWNWGPQSWENEQSKRSMHSGVATRLPSIVDEEDFKVDSSSRCEEQQKPPSAHGLGVQTASFHADVDPDERDAACARACDASWV
ncbi:unnamed protein product [Cercospora beticola]|nr:unnamed protein product [Cercospora beticola]